MKNAKNETVLLIVMVVVVAIISMINSQFLTVYNLFDLLRSSITDGFFAIGVMIVMISGGIDISFPAIGAFMYLDASGIHAQIFHVRVLRQCMKHCFQCAVIPPFGESGIH